MEKTTECVGGWVGAQDVIEWSQQGPRNSVELCDGIQSWPDLGK